MFGVFLVLVCWFHVSLSLLCFVLLSSVLWHVVRWAFAFSVLSFLRSFGGGFCFCFLCGSSVGILSFFFVWVVSVFLRLMCFFCVGVSCVGLLHYCLFVFYGVWFRHLSSFVRLVFFVAFIAFFCLLS